MMSEAEVASYLAHFVATDSMIQHDLKHADDDAYYLGPVDIDDWELPAALIKFAGHSRWLAWRNEPNPGKPLSKTPYQGIRRKARSNDPTTWLPLDTAQAVAHGIADEFGLGGGVGLVLGALDDGACLIGIDLDSCRNRQNGDLESWAEEVIRRFGSYAETSPSLTGVKVFALVAPSDVPMMRTILGGPDGRQFKRSGGEHPPAIEVYTGNRYFAVTGRAGGTRSFAPSTLRISSG
jgi:hypothetical protein